MNDPEFLGELHGVKDAEGITFERQRNLEHARRYAAHWLRDIRLASFGGDRQRGKTDGPCAFPGTSRIVNVAFIHDTGRDLRVSAIRYSAPYIFFMLSYLTKACNCGMRNSNR